MAFKVVHSENYYLKQEMKKLLHYHQKKVLYMETKNAREKPRHMVIYYFFLIMNKSEDIFIYKIVSYNKSSIKAEGASENKHFLLEKSPPPLRKILNLISSLWNRLKGKEQAQAYIIVHLLITALFASLLIHSACEYLLSHFHVDGWGQAGTTSANGDRMSYAYMMFT